MGQRDQRVDIYIEKAAPFAKPILSHFREVVHRGCPKVVETIKWGMPSFEYKGPFCSMAAFKQHCAVGFWKAALLEDANKTGSAGASKTSKAVNWGAPGRDPIPAKIASMDDLPSQSALLRIIKQAKKLNDEGVKNPQAKKAREALPMPKDFQTALKQNKKADTNFKTFSPSKKRDYIEWITEAKREETRLSRIATAVEWISEGKSRNWKYE